MLINFPVFPYDMLYFSPQNPCVIYRCHLCSAFASSSSC